MPGWSAWPPPAPVHTATAMSTATTDHMGAARGAVLENAPVAAWKIPLLEPPTCSGRRRRAAMESTDRHQRSSGAADGSRQRGARRGAARPATARVPSGRRAAPSRLNASCLLHARLLEPTAPCSGRGATTCPTAAAPRSASRWPWREASRARRGQSPIGCRARRTASRAGGPGTPRCCGTHTS